MTVNNVLQKHYSSLLKKILPFSILGAWPHQQNPAGISEKEDGELLMDNLRKPTRRKYILVAIKPALCII